MAFVLVGVGIMRATVSPFAVILARQNRSPWVRLVRNSHNGGSTLDDFDEVLTASCTHDYFFDILG